MSTIGDPIPVETNNTNVDSVADDMVALPGNPTANNSLNIDRIRTYNSLGSLLHNGLLYLNTTHTLFSFLLLLLLPLLCRYND